MTSHQGRTRTDADYGLGNVTINCDSLGLIDESELTQRIVDAFESPGYVPPRLPAVATELLALSNQPDVELSQLEALLERDPTLAGEVLSLCKSAYYDRGGKVKTLRDALARIGLKKLGEVVMMAAMSARVFRSKAYKASMEALQEHCRVTAHLARLISDKSPKVDDHAFLCGLLHDVGIAGILVVLGDAKRGEQPPELATLWPAIHRAHAMAGSRMVQLWELSEDIQRGVSGHHTIAAGDEENPLAAAICLADALADSLGMGFVPPAPERDGTMGLVEATLVESCRVDESDAVTIERAKQALELSDEDFEQLHAAASAWAEKQSAA